MFDFLSQLLNPTVRKEADAELERQLEALRTSEERFRLLVEGTKDYAIFMLDPAGHIVSWNPGAARIKGYKAEEIIGQHFSRFYPPEDIQAGKPERELRIAAAEGKYEEEGLRLRKDGSRFWASVVITALRDEAGNLRGFGKVTRDVTARKQAEENARRLLQEEAARRAAEENAQLIESQREQLRVTLTSIGDGVITTDGEGRITLLNPVAEALTGWTNKEAAGQPLKAVFHILNENTRQTVEDPVAKVFSTGRIVGLANHTVLIARDGTERPIDDSAAPIRDDQGRVLGVVLVFRDVTQRRRSEREQKDAENRLRSVVDHVLDGIITIDEHGIIQTFNPAAEKLFGFMAPEIIGQNVKRLMPEPYHGEHDGYIGNYLRTGTAKIIGQGREVVGRRKDGSTFPMELAISEFSLEGQRHFTGIVRDITERKKADESLRESARREKDRAAELEAIMRATPTPIWIALDPRCHRITGNPASFKLLGLPEDTNVSATAPDGDPAQRGFREYRGDQPIPPDQLPVQVAARGIPVQGAEMKFVFSDGRVRYIYGNAEPLYNADGSVRGSVAAFADVTPFKEAETALKDADRRKNEFLATLAHELRNPLAPIVNAVELLRQAGDDAAVSEQARQMLERQVRQMVRLIDDLLDVSRITSGKLQLRKERVQLAAVVQSAMEASRPLIESAAHQLTVTLPEEPIDLEADPTRLSQVISNLLNNAARYTERGGHIWLSAERQGGQVAVSVRDTGIGIPAEHLPHIFDMFSQVSPALERSQGGLGIGLSLVRGLVELHGGTIEARSAPGQGSEFIVRLPVAAVSVAAAVEPTDDGQPDGSQRTLRILVVDDNRDAAESLAMMLQVWGHDTQMAHDGVEAIQAAAVFRPDAVLLDIGMPKMNGYEAARHIREQPWGKRVVLIALTGWGQDEDKRRASEAGFQHHLVKPVEPGRLEQLLEGLTRSRT